MIPYPVEEEMSPENSWYNYLHSRTRIIVERTIGMVKNRFRILKVPLNQKRDDSAARTETEEMGRIIVTCFVLHNILIDLQDPVGLIAVKTLSTMEMRCLKILFWHCVMSIRNGTRFGNIFSRTNV
jgi:hypothetical protein